MNSQSASATLTFFDEAGARGPVRAPLTVVPSLIVPGGILPMEISDSFPKESQLRQSRASRPHYRLLP